MGIMPPNGITELKTVEFLYFWVRLTAYILKYMLLQITEAASFHKTQIDILSTLWREFIFKNQYFTFCQ